MATLLSIFSLQSFHLAKWYLQQEIRTPSDLAVFPQPTLHRKPQNETSTSRRMEKPLDLDEAAPPILYAQTHFLQSIPLDAREQNGTLLIAEFNPSIVKLPESQIPYKEAVYLSAYRVSNQHNCGTNNHTQNQNRVELLGLALLDENLNILQEGIYQIRQLYRIFEDPRLFVLHNRIYISSFVKMIELWVVPPSNQKVPTLVPPAWNTSLQIYFNQSYVCTQDLHIFRRAKNLAYFVDADNRTILEASPMANKEIIDLNRHCTGRGLVEDPPGKLKITPNNLPQPSFATTDELYYREKGEPNVPYTAERGSYCCVEIIHQGKPYLVGMSHSKTRYRRDGRRIADVPFNSFMSSFYAMEPRMPYRVVARSGRFCLGMGPENEPDFDGSDMEKKLWIGKTFDCPRIHFVSGMTEMANDASRIIISYGVSDCMPRFVVVTKIAIFEMLFPES